MAEQLNVDCMACMNRYRAVTTKQALMAGQSSLASLSPNHTIPFLLSLVLQGFSMGFKQWVTLKLKQ
ncbi:hypothetical protein CsSME_00007385 [Camellia sinensis var. sinensis]